MEKFLRGREKQRSVLLKKGEKPLDKASYYRTIRSTDHNGKTAREIDSAVFKVTGKARKICQRTSSALGKGSLQWTPFGLW